MGTEQVWRVLLVDDDQEDFIITREMLREATWRKFELEWVNTFEAGLHAICEKLYDIALVDYDLGSRTGIELIEALNAQECQVPLVLFTGRGNNAVDVEAMQAGATMYLTKNEANPLLLERIIRYAIERKQAEERFTRSEANYHHLFANMIDAFALHELILDKTGKAVDYHFLEINPSFERLTGMKRQQMIGRTVREIQPDFEESWLQAYANVALTGKSARFNRFIPKLKKHLDIVAFSPQRGQFAILFRDKTDQVHLIENLQESQRHFQALASATFEGIVISEDGRILDMNEQMEKISGYSLDDVVGKEISIFVAPEDRARQMDNAEAAREGDFEYIGLREDGSRYILEAQTKIIAYQDRCVRVTAVRDITAQRQIIADLKESQERYSSLFNNQHTPMLVIDPLDGHIMDANPAAVDFYGWSRSEMLGMKISQINALPEEQVRQRMLEAGSNHGGGVFHFPHRLASGEIRKVTVHTGPICFGKKQYLYSIIHDHEK